MEHFGAENELPFMLLLDLGNAQEQEDDGSSAQDEAMKNRRFLPFGQAKSFDADDDQVDTLIDMLRDNTAPLTERSMALNRLLLMSEAPAEDLARFLSGESFSLSNPLNNQCSSYQKLTLVQCLMTLLREDPQDFKPEMKEAAMDILRNLSRFDLNRIYLYGIPRLLEVLLDCAQHGESTKIKELSLVTLNNLALDEFISAGILDRPGFVDLYMAGAENGETPGIRRWSVGNLRNLAVASANALRLCDPPYFVDEMLLRCVRDGHNCAEVKETALWALVNLTCGGNNRARLFHKPKMLETLIDAARAADIHTFALRCLLSFSYLEENLIPMYRAPRLLDSIVDCVEIVEKSLRKRSAVKLGEFAEDSFHVLQEFASDRSLAENLYTQQHRLRNSLLNIYNLCASSDVSSLGKEQQQEALKIRLWVLAIFKAFGCSKQHLQHFNGMVVLCSVRGIPRLGRNRPVRQLSIELIRVLAEFLAPKSVAYS